MANRELRRDEFFPDRKARVHVRREPRQSDITQHRHEFYEIAVVLSGSAIHVTEGFRHRVEAGDILIITTTRKHGYKDTRCLNLVNILFRRDIIPRLRQELGGLASFHLLFEEGRKGQRRSAFPSHLRMTEKEFALIVEWINLLEAETRQKKQGGYLLAEAYLTLIIGGLCRRHSHLTVRQDATGRIGQLLSWLESHLHESLTMEALAKRCGMSERNFYRSFKKTTGCTPARYLQQARMRQAAVFLRDGKRRITEVAAASGFDDGNYFSTVFRKEYGMSPRDYRCRSK